MVDIKKVRALLRQQNRKTAGKEGERFAEQWMGENGWSYESVEQGIGTKSQALASMGGKRPDFLVEVDSSCFIALDAKYVTTDGRQAFRMKDSEIQEYHQLKTYLESNFSDFTCEVVFIVFPKEDIGEKLVFVSLDDFNNATSCQVYGEPGKYVDISVFGGLWYDHTPKYE
ncbi:hypothetical protein CGT98_18380 [Vibrio metoecus]|nr:hypothetical protein CGT98_18380 [Vibrio metoecus]